MLEQEEDPAVEEERLHTELSTHADTHMRLLADLTQILEQEVKAQMKLDELALEKVCERCV